MLVLQSPQTNYGFGYPTINYGTSLTPKPISMGQVPSGLSNPTLLVMLAALATAYILARQ